MVVGNFEIRRPVGLASRQSSTGGTPVPRAKTMEEPSPRDSPSSILALVCGGVCVAAYVWPILHVVGGTYDGVMTWCLSYLLLLPAIPTGSIAAFLALTKSDATRADLRRAKWGLGMIWYPIAAILLIVFADSVRRHW